VVNVRKGNDNDKLRQLYIDSDDLVEQVASSFEFKNSRRIEFSTEFESYVVPICRAIFRYVESNSLKPKPEVAPVVGFCFCYRHRLLLTALS